MQKASVVKRSIEGKKSLFPKIKLLQSLFDFLFPPVCPACEGIAEGKKLFCSECIDEFQLIPSNFRCRYCFDPLLEESILCRYCRKHPPHYRKGAAFEARRSTRSLQNHLHSFPHLIKVTAAYSIIQFSKLSWPNFDFVTYLPRPHRKEVHLLAKEIALFLEVPLKSIFSRHPSHLFEWNWELSASIAYQNILIVDDFRDREEGYLYLFKKRRCRIYLFSLMDS